MRPALIRDHWAVGRPSSWNWPPLEPQRCGGLHHIAYLGITAMGAPDLSVPAQWPTGRVIRPGDVVTCDISAAAAPGFAGQDLRTFHRRRRRPRCTARCTPPRPLAAGMTVVVQPNVVTRDRHAGSRPENCSWSPTKDPSACTPTRKASTRHADPAPPMTARHTPRP